MNIRQYRHDLDIIRGDTVWRHEDLERASIDSSRLRRPSVLFRDGRVFPLEHRLDNFEDPSLYGQFVRRSIQDLCQLASDPRVIGGTVVVAGVVKEPELAVPNSEGSVKTT